MKYNDLLHPGKWTKRLNSMARRVFSHLVVCATENDSRSIDFRLFPDFQVLVTNRMASTVATPAFYIDRTLISNRIFDLEKELESSFPLSRIAFSFKTNYEAAQLKLFRQKGVVAEVVSGREYDFAKKMGYSGKEIIFNGPLKTDEELLLAVRDGSSINLDSWKQIDQIIALASVIDGAISVGLRLNAPIHGMKNSRFGFSSIDGEAYEAVKKLTSKRINITGFHRHIGTSIYSPSMYRESAFQIGSFIASLSPVIRNGIRYIDVGGGYPSNGFSPRSLQLMITKPPGIGEYVASLARGFDESKLSLSTVELIVEPGRYLVDDAIIFASTVLDVKIVDNRQTVLIDGTVSQLPLVNYQKQIIRVLKQHSGKYGRGKRSETIVYGASCREDDVLYDGQLPLVQEGDLLLFFSVGAYNQSMGSDFIFGKTRVVIL